MQGAGRRSFGLGAAGLAACGLAAAALAQAPPSEPVTVSPDKNRHGTVLKLDGNPSALSGGTQSPSSIALDLPRGMRLDTVARRRLCRAEEAARVECPRDGRVGFGHTTTYLRGYLFPGGETEVVATLTAFLGAPESGTRATLVIQYKLQPENVITGLQQEFGSLAPRGKGSVTGRITPLASGPYGLEISFDGFPGGFTVPNPLSARVTRFKLALGAIREIKQTFYHRRRVTDVDRRTGKPYKRTVRIKDHRLITHHLLTNPRRCNQSWPYALRVGFPSGEVTHTGVFPCRTTKRVSRVPPETPSAPQRD